MEHLIPTIPNAEVYELILNSLEEGFLIHDMERKIIKFNPAACRILGIAPSQLKSKSTKNSIWEILNEDGEVLAYEDYPSTIALRTAKPVLDVKVGVRKMDNTISWVRTSAIPVFTKNKNEASYTLSLVRDNNDMVSMERHNKELRSLFDLSFETAGLGVWIWNLLTKEHWANSVLQKKWNVNEHPNQASIFDAWLKTVNKSEVVSIKSKFDIFLIKEDSFQIEYNDINDSHHRMLVQVVRDDSKNVPLSALIILEELS